MPPKDYNKSKAVNENKNVLNQTKNKINGIKEKMNIDLFLDVYNDYMTLYYMFGDEEYLTVANIAMDKLKKSA